MITKTAKTLAVFVAVASLAFAGFAIATTFGGPDWRALTRAEYFQHYNFAQGAAPEYLWTATRVSDGNQIASSKRLPEVLVKVMDDILQRQQAKLTVLKDREPLLQNRVESLEKLKAEDAAALAAYDEKQRQRLANVREEIEQTAKEVIDKTKEAQELENTIALRREEIIAQRRQVHELRTDQFRLGEQKKNLENLIIQVQGDQARASEQLQGLKKQVP